MSNEQIGTFFLGVSIALLLIHLQDRDIFPKEKRYRIEIICLVVATILVTIYFGWVR